MYIYIHSVCAMMWSDRSAVCSNDDCLGPQLSCHSSENDNIHNNSA